MNRWKVERLRIGPDGDFHPSGCWQVRGPGYYVNRILETHAEAIALADKQARTVEVTLPRNPLPLKIEGEEGDTDIVVVWKPKENSVSIKDDFQNDEILLRRFELQPLALALLALARRKEQA